MPLTAEQEQILSTIGPVVSSAVADQIEELAKSVDERMDVRMRQMRSMAGTAKRVEEKPGGSILSKVIVAQAAADLSARKTDLKQISAVDFASKTWGEGDPSAILLGSEKSMDSTTDLGLSPEGGVHEEIIELTRPRIALMRLGVQTPPMVSGSYRMHRMTKDAAANYRGETERIIVSRIEHEKEALTAKFLAALIPLSNPHIRYLLQGGSPIGGSFNLLSHVAIQAARRISVRKDQALIRSNGTTNTPKGVRWQGLDENVIPWSGDGSFASILNFFGRLLSRIEDQDLDIENAVWLLPPRLKHYLMFSVLTPQGTPFFYRMLSEGQFLGLPYATTNNLPNNLGDGGDESEVLLFDAAKVIVAESLDTSVDTSQDGSYWENGVQQNAFSNDETLVRVTNEHDLGVEDPKSIIVGNGINFDSGWAIAA